MLHLAPLVSMVGWVMQPLFLQGYITGNLESTYVSSPLFTSFLSSLFFYLSLSSSYLSITIIYLLSLSRYCTNLVSDDLNRAVEALLEDLVRFQDRVYHNEPQKYKAKRRYVCGLKEVNKHLQLKRLKCVIIPPNLDRIQSTGQY